MNFLKKIWEIVIDALFPLSAAEKELADMTPEAVLAHLPPAPAFDRSVLPLQNTKSIFAYKDERVSRMVWCIKYKKSPHAIRLAGYAMYNSLPKNGKIVLVPVPITRRRRRERGYNQCELLLDEVKRLDVENRVQFEFNLLKRTKNNTDQKVKGRTERLSTSKNVFEVNLGLTEKLKDDQPMIIVADDVVTTGSTIKAAQDSLAAAGFLNIGGLSLAH